MLIESITVEKIIHEGKTCVATVQKIDDKKFYALCEIMEQLGMKGDFLGQKSNNPITIAATTVWGYVVYQNHFIETIFVDEECAKELMSRKQ